MTAEILRPAQTSDAAAIETFLLQYTDSSMFLRSNLRHHGPCGGAAQVATKMWLQGDPIRGVIGLSTAGYVTVQMPDGVPSTVREVLADAEVGGISGPADQVAEVGLALGLGDRAALVGRGVEPLYRLDLAGLAPPDGEGALRLATAADMPHLVPWRVAYRKEIEGFSASADAARRDLESWIAERRLALLCDGDTCLAMTGFNATLPDMVQVGGVYTPPERRGRGHARRAVALHLARARDQGVETAILFSASAAASRAYEAIGFQQIGRYQLLVFESRRRVPRL